MIVKTLARFYSQAALNECQSVAKIPKPTHTQKLIVTKYEQGCILKKFLNFHLAFPSSLVQKLLRQRKIFVIKSTNQQEVHLIKSGNSSQQDVTKPKMIRVLDEKYALECGDQLIIKHKQEDFSNRKTLSDIIDRPIPPAESSEHQQAVRDIKASVLYQDPDCVVINKPSNIAIHAGTKNTAVHMQRFLGLLKDSQTDNDPSIVHRLDKRVSGTLLLGRNMYSTRLLSEAFRRSSDPQSLSMPVQESVDAFGQQQQSVGQMMTADTQQNADALQIEKTYWALLTDIPANSSGTIDNYLYTPPEADIDITSDSDPGDFGDVPSRFLVSCVSDPQKINRHYRHLLKRAVTRYEVLDNVGRQGCWVRLMPATGRKHQLRVHCAEILKSPMLGDFKYGIRSYRRLHEIGWGRYLDFGKYTGVKSPMFPHGMPVFLHQRQLRIKNYFRHLGAGASGVDTQEMRRKVGGECYRDDADLVVTAGLPPIWRELMRACHLDSSLKV